MEPVKGGMLANPPEPVSQLFKNADKNSSCASWAIKFAANLDGIITVLSGMSSVEQMKDNLSYMKNFTKMSEEDMKVISNAQNVLASIPIIPCTSCNYCSKVCPENIGISGSFTAMNLYTLYKNLPAAKNQENWLVANHGKNNASKCIKCGKCEQVCPQHILIRDKLVEVGKVFGTN